MSEAPKKDWQIMGCSSCGLLSSCAHDNYDAEASPNPKWVEVSDAEEAAFRNAGGRDA
jgi:hypothetical protein